MSWVEQITPDDDIKVDIIYPKEYAEYSFATIKSYSAAAILYCKAAAILGRDEADFMLEGMTVVQVYSLTSALKSYGVELEHEISRIGNTNYVMFYADIAEFRKRYENGEWE